MTTTSPTKAPNVPIPQPAVEPDEQEVPSIAQPGVNLPTGGQGAAQLPGANLPIGGQGPEQLRRNSQGFDVVPNQGLDPSPNARLKRLLFGNTHVDPTAFQGVFGKTLLIFAFLEMARVLVENQILLNETHSTAQKEGSKTKADQTKKALTEEARIIQEAKEGKATCDIIIDAAMIAVAIIAAALTAGILAPVLLVLAAAVLVAKMAIDICKKQLIDSGDYEGAAELDDAATALEITATVLSSVAGGVAFAKSVASIAAKTAARVAARGVTEATKKASTTALKGAAESGKTVTKKMAETVTKRSAAAAVKEAAQKNASKASVEAAAKAGAEEGLKEALKTGIFKAADKSATIGKEAIKETVENVTPKLVKEAVKNYRKIIVQAVKKQLARTTGSMDATVRGINALSLFEYKADMADADRINDQLEVLLMLINKIIAALGKLKEGANKDTKGLVDAVINAMRSVGGNFKLATNTLSSLATAMSPGGK